MPESVEGFLPQNHLLSFPSITRLVSVLAQAGVNKVRLTGGEPLMRPKLWELVAQLAEIKGLRQIALTTNGMLLASQLDQFVRAG